MPHKQIGERNGPIFIFVEHCCWLSSRNRFVIVEGETSKIIRSSSRMFFLKIIDVFSFEVLIVVFHCVEQEREIKLFVHDRMTFLCRETSKITLEKNNFVSWTILPSEAEFSLQRNPLLNEIFHVYDKGSFCCCVRWR